MPIITNNQFSNYEFFMRHEPYVLGVGLVPADSISEMISINLLEMDENTFVEYFVGDTYQFQVPLKLKNLTVNMDLEIDLDWNENALFAFTEFKISSPFSYTLKPLSEIIITFSLDKNKLNNTRFLGGNKDSKLFDTDVDLKITQPVNGELAQRATNRSFYEKINLRDILDAGHPKDGSVDKPHVIDEPTTDVYPKHDRSHH